MEFAKVFRKVSGRWYKNSIGVIPDDAILAITGITPEQLQELKEEKESEKPTDNIT